MSEQKTPTWRSESDLLDAARVALDLLERYLNGGADEAEQAKERLRAAIAEAESKTP